VPGQVVVALPHAVAGDGFLDYGFGQKYFHGRNTACIYLRARESNWFQEPQVLDLAARIRAFLGPEARVVTYGASMGAYGALLLSGPLGAEKVLAIAPQFSINRARVPWETRWKQAADRIGGFIHDIDAHIAPGARKIVFYDRLSRDRGQVDLFAADASWDLVNLPCASHQVLRFLQETGALKPLLADLFGPGPDTALIRARARANRRSSALYWLTLALYAQRRRPALARAALRRCAELGGPKKKIKRIWADLHAGGPALPAPRPDRIGA
jgi:hypothetical protein